MSKYKKLFLFVFLSLAAGIIFYSCKKDSTEPAGVIKSGTLLLEVSHHSWTIPDIPVYIKKDVIEFPGKDTASYDFSIHTNQAGTAQFSGLIYGSYYVFVHGWDPIFQDTVIG